MNNANSSNHNNNDSGVMSYTEAFPPLPETSMANGRSQAAPQAWRPAVPAQATTVTETVQIPYVERRKKGDFGGNDSEMSVLADIMRDTGTNIVMTTNKDASITMLITGKRDTVRTAKNDVLRCFKTQANAALPVPKEYHRFILGGKGKTLQELEHLSGTKITVPRADDASTEIRIVGPKEGIEMASRRIREIYVEQSKRAFEKLDIPKNFHPFICGPYNSVIENLQKQFTNAEAKTELKINVPPPMVQNNVITISGDKEGVLHAKEVLEKSYKEYAEKVKEVVLDNIPKSQHRYIQGPNRSAHLHEILAQTGVWVEVPPIDSDSSKITIRGEAKAISKALPMVFARANSGIKVELDAPRWAHKFMIGKGGEKIRSLSDQYQECNINFDSENGKISIEGPPSQVEAVKKVLETETKDIVSNMAVQEMTVDEKFMKHIIGKSGANVSKLKTELGVQIRTQDVGKPNQIMIEGQKASVQEAVKRLKDLVGKMENERSRDMIIDNRLHKLLIGQKGDKIKEIKEMFKEVNVLFPDAAEKSDVVTIRGPKEEVDKCFKHLEKLVKELVLSNHRVEVPMFKDMQRLIGKNGDTIRKIREDTSTRIDLPPKDDPDADVIVITGTKENAEKARKMILDIQSKIANEIELKITIPSKVHTSIIGKNGQTIKGIQQECGNVNIQFPPSNSGKEEITIRGPKEDAEKAKKILSQMAADKELSSYTVEVPAKQEYHKYIIGANRMRVTKLREELNVRIVFPSLTAEEGRDLVTIIGKKEDVEKAKAKVEDIIKELSNIVDDTVDVPLEYHKTFVMKRGEEIRNVQQECGNVEIKFPKQEESSTVVRLRGPRDAVDAAKKRMLQMVDNWQSYVTIELEINPRFYGHVMGPQGSRVGAVCEDFNVYVKFPERQRQNGEGPREEQQRSENEENGVATNGERPQETIKITGRPEDCQAAKEALLALVPIEDTMDVPSEYHGSIIGPKGARVRELMDTHKVNINIPKMSQEKSDLIRISGVRKNVDQAKAALEELIKSFEKEKEEWALQSFRLEMKVDPKYHFKLIGAKRSAINRFSEQNQVDVKFPRSEDKENDTITIIGYEDKVHAARDKIQALIDKWDAQYVLDVRIDHRVHGRIIGTHGATLRKLMDKFKVDIRLPRSGDPDPDLIWITGDENNCFEAESELKRLEDLFLEDVLDAAPPLQAYLNPASRTFENSGRQANAKGFVVAGAPWEQRGDSQQTPQTGDLQEFPNLAGNSNGAGNGNGPQSGSPSPWGPRR